MRTRHFLALTAFAALLACGRPTPAPTPAATDAATTTLQSSEGALAGPAATLLVENNSIFDVRIYAIRGTERVRLGMVTTMSSGSFDLPPELIDRAVILYADPVGGRTRLRSDAVRVWPGQHVEFKLEKRLRSYSLAVY